MSQNQPPRPGYEDALMMVRADLSSRSGLLDVAGLDRALERAAAGQRRRAWVVVFAFLAVIAVWIISVVAHPISTDVCPDMQRVDIFELGLLPALNVLLCMGLVRRPHAGAQMFVRACCWSYLVVGALSMVGDPGLMPWSFPAVALGCGASLLVLGNRGLEPERYRGAFVPVAHRVTLTWAMILAVADMQTLLAVNHANNWYHPLNNACSVGMVIAAIGLYRLRAWGLWLNLGMNALVAALALSGHLSGMGDPLRYMLVATAIAQAGLMVPLVRSIVRGEADEQPRLLWVGAWVARAVIVTIMVTTAALAWRGPELEDLRRYCAERMACKQSLEAAAHGGPRPEPSPRS